MGRGWPVRRPRWPAGSTESCRRSPRPFLDPTQAFSEGPPPRWGQDLAAVPLWQGLFVPVGSRSPTYRGWLLLPAGLWGPGAGAAPGEAGRTGELRVRPASWPTVVSGRRMVWASLSISRALGSAWPGAADSARWWWVFGLSEWSEERERGGGAPGRRRPPPWWPWLQQEGAVGRGHCSDTLRCPGQPG